MISDTILPEDLSAARDEADQAYYHFVPRKDQPELFDQQTAFVDSRTTGLAFLIGGNGAGTTECAMHKIARFVFETPPPREDTPFLIVGDTYLQAMKVCWKEKLYGHGHIPRSEIDFDRIVWHKKDMRWPFHVPLRDWPGRPGKNWVLEFRSSEEGRRKMQSASIGGFCFTEQQPWEIVVETMRGCREYNFPGSKFYEFTPVDPRLTWELQQMQQNNRLPPGWDIFRANTKCALDAGHIDATWFEQFFGMVSQEELQTRLIGAWATFAGLIYQSFNERIHCADHINVPLAGVQHRRAIDWGAGPENAFVCLWAYRNSFGQYFVYDEYWSTSSEKSMEDHLQTVRERHPWPEDWGITGDELRRAQEWFGTTWADPSELSWIRWANQHHIPGGIMGALNDVYRGIECVRQHLKVLPSIEQPKLIFDKRKCPNLYREFNTYSWEEGTGDSARNPKDAKPKPLKKDDHALDALRYLLFSEDSFKDVEITSKDRGFSPERYGILQSSGNGNGNGHGSRGAWRRSIPGLRR